MQRTLKYSLISLGLLLAFFTGGCGGEEDLYVEPNFQSQSGPLESDSRDCNTNKDCAANEVCASTLISNEDGCEVFDTGRCLPAFDAYYSISITNIVGAQENVPENDTNNTDIIANPRVCLVCGKINSCSAAHKNITSLAGLLMGENIKFAENASCKIMIDAQNTDGLTSSLAQMSLEVTPENLRQVFWTLNDGNLKVNLSLIPYDNQY